MTTLSTSALLELQLVRVCAGYRLFRWMKQPNTYTVFALDGDNSVLSMFEFQDEQHFKDVADNYELSDCFGL